MKKFNLHNLKNQYLTVYILTNKLQFGFKIALIFLLILLLFFMKQNLFIINFIL